MRLALANQARLAGLRAAKALLLTCGCLGLASAQILLSGGGVVRLHNTDMAIFEAGEERKDLPCTVISDKPFLGFDLKFHSGYDVTVPLAELSGNENLLTILFRVVPDGKRNSPVYFMQRIRVPDIEDEAKGDALLQGAFDLGEGKYHVDWLVRDRAERVCSSSWDVEAKLPPKDSQMALNIPTGAVLPAEGAQFREEPPVERASSDLLNLKVLVNFAPQRAHASTLRPIDTAALVSLLRTLSRDPRIGKFSLVAFNIHEQRVIYRQESADRIDFPSLGASLQQINPGTVDLKRLAQKNGTTEFLADLMTQELGSATTNDAVVFAGPKAMLEANIPQEQLKRIGESEVPIFYMNYILNPFANPWRDSIGHAVKALKGVEFTISKPRDLWFAVSDMVNRLVKTRNAKQVASVQLQ